MWWLSLACVATDLESGGVADSADPVDTADTVDTAKDTADTEGSVANDTVLLSLNLHAFVYKDTAYASNDARFAAIATFAAEAGVTVMAVQEACVRERDDGGEDVAMDLLAAALQEATGVEWSTAWVDTHIAWEGEEDEALEGIGILARSPIEDVESFEYAVQGALLRKTLAGTVDGLRIHAVHLEYNDALTNRAQARQTGAYALVHDTAEARPVLVGDFNAVETDDSIQDLLAAGFSRLGGADIDHVLAPVGVEAVSVEVVLDGDARVSDHPGVLARLRRTEATAVETRLIADLDAGFGHYLAVRGEGSPLDWERGWPAVATAANRWELAFQGVDELRWKWLYDDVTWESGEDHVTAAGGTSTSTPSF